MHIVQAPGRTAPELPRAMDLRRRKSRARNPAPPYCTSTTDRDCRTTAAPTRALSTTS